MDTRSDLFMTMSWVEFYIVVDEMIQPIVGRDIAELIATFTYRRPFHIRAAVVHMFRPTRQDPWIVTWTESFTDEELRNTAAFYSWVGHVRRNNSEYKRRRLN